MNTGVHLHVSVLDFLIVLAYLVIAQFLLRALAAHTSNTPFGKALGALFA